MDDYERITADSTVECRKGSLKVETPRGVFLIMVGTEVDGRMSDTVKVYPNVHPGEKKVLIKKGKSTLSMSLCKTAKLRKV